MTQSLFALAVISVFLPACSALEAFEEGWQRSAAQRQSAEVSNPRAAYCAQVRSQAMLAPTRTGNFGESLQNANMAYANCMAGNSSPQSFTLQGPSGKQLNCTPVSGTNYDCR